MRGAVGLLLGLFFVASPAVADSPKPVPPGPAKTIAELDQRLADTFRAANVPGASVAVFENGAMVLAKGYGVSDIATKTPVTPDTIFRAGSISKSFVGISVMMLVEEGKLDLNAKLADLAPEIHFVNPWETTDPVRLSHLMEHTTGFDDIRFSQYLFDGKDMPLLKAIQLYGPYELRWKPGTYVAYSNAPPVIAGYLVEKASGMSWADFTRTRIFEPLGMGTAHWTKTPDIAGRISKSYAPDAKTEQPYIDIPGKPAGSLNVTPSDLAKMALMLAGRGTYNGVTLLKPESVARLETPQTSLASRSGLTYGYGFGNLTIPREKAVFHGHDGGIDGFLALYVYDPDHRSGFVAMVNAQQGQALKAGEEILSYLQRDLPALPPAPEIKTDPTELKALSGFYQTVAPRNQNLFPLQDLLDWTPINVSKEGKLTFGGVARTEVGPGLFQRPDRAVPTAVFAKTSDGTVMLTSTDALRKVPLAEFIAKGTYLAIFNLTAAISLLYLFLWVPSALLGRLKSRGGIWPRIVPVLALAGTAGLFALVLMAVSNSSWAGLVALGSISPISVSIYAVSWTIPAFGLLAFAMGLFPRDGVSLFVRILGLTSGLLALIAAIHLWPYGWIGLRLWT